MVGQVVNSHFKKPYGLHSPAGVMIDVEQLKQQAGIRACDYVKDGMKVGLGTGSTVKYSVIELGRKINEEGMQIVGVPTSIATADLARKVGIPLVELDDVTNLDVVIDGTDEFDSNFQLIKGGGAALLREKIVAQQSAAMVVVADDRKEVDTLGAFPLPIEITPFSHGITIERISQELGCQVTLRNVSGDTLTTDNGNYIADAHTGPNITDPSSCEKALLQIAGVVQVGLFINMCDVVILASENGIRTLTKPDGRLS
jgi:ribose 5-phosphate isomerase A